MRVTNVRISFVIVSLLVPRQSLLRNVVSGESFLNLYVFGIEPEKEFGVSVFSVGRGRFLRSDDGAVAVLGNLLRPLASTSEEHSRFARLTARISV